jgi:hypothetical protein
MTIFLFKYTKILTIIFGQADRTARTIRSDGQGEFDSAQIQLYLLDFEMEVLILPSVSAGWFTLLIPFVGQ